ncbi:SHOCT domain-containing protein [Lactobacillus mellis]|nr:SHOCT domain-containing protein [Bombilactobacillus mellis]
MGKNKLIVRRLIAGILLILFAFLVMSESFDLYNLGANLNNNTKIMAASGSGMLLAFAAGVSGAIYAATCKIRPIKGIEWTILIINCLIIGLVRTNQYIGYFKDMWFFQFGFLVLLALASPYKKGYKDMPFKKLNDKTSNSPDTSTVSNSSDTNSTSNSPDISTVPNSSNTNSTSNSADTSTASNSSDVILIKKHLNELKELLDDGTITQAEYDAKRKKILGI